MYENEKTIDILTMDGMFNGDDAQSDKYLTFDVDSEKYGVAIKLVLEIIGIQKIVPVPDLPEYMKGIISLRGKIIPVIDGRTRLNKPVIDYDERTCIIILDLEGASTGLIVDSVEEVINIPENQIESLQSIGQRDNRFVSGIGKISDDVILIISAEKLLTNEQKNMLKDVMEEAL